MLQEVMPKMHTIEKGFHFQRFLWIFAEPNKAPQRYQYMYGESPKMHDFKETGQWSCGEWGSAEQGSQGSASAAAAVNEIPGPPGRMDVNEMFKILSAADPKLNWDNAILNIVHQQNSNNVFLRMTKELANEIFDRAMIVLQYEESKRVEKEAARSSGQASSKSIIF